MAQKVTPFFMFEGKAEEAINFYVSVFENSRVVSMRRYGPGEAGAECIDSPVKHAFTFTPAISLFVDYTEEHEIDDLFGNLSKDGHVFMPLDNYGFSRKFGWVADRFGVAWQINLP